MTPFDQHTAFQTMQGEVVPAITAAEMRDVDRIAVQDFGLSVLQMMENAGRSLALHAMQLCRRSGRILIFAGSGGNGGGGMACGRHLHNHGYQVAVVLAKDPDSFSEATAHQHHTLSKAGVEIHPAAPANSLLEQTALVIDALIGYSLNGEPRGAVKVLIQEANASSLPVLALDVPSGVEASTGHSPGLSIVPTRTLTLALPKIGLRGLPGRLFLADIGIPSNLYKQIGLEPGPIFSGDYWIELQSVDDAV